MSRKKIYTTIGLNFEVFDQLRKEAEFEQRSRSFIVEKVLIQHFEKIKIGEGGEVKNGNKIASA